MPNCMDASEIVYKLGLSKLGISNNVSWTVQKTTSILNSGDKGLRKGLKWMVAQAMKKPKAPKMTKMSFFRKKCLRPKMTIKYRRLVVKKQIVDSIQSVY